MKPRKNLLTAILTLLCLSTAISKSLYVSPNGSANGSGEQSDPVNSLIAARDIIRDLKASGKSGSIDVIIAPGNYLVTEGLTLDSRDSGNAENPITYKCIEGKSANFFGGKIIKKEWFKPLDRGSEFAQRLVNKDAVNCIVVADLRANGVTEYGEITSHGWALEHPDRIPPSILSVAGERMTISRWPNPEEASPYLIDTIGMMKTLGLPMETMRGFVSYNEIIDRGANKDNVPEGTNWYDDETFMNEGAILRVPFDRMSNWEDTHEIFVNGVLSASWEWIYNRVKEFDSDSRIMKLEIGAVKELGWQLKVAHFFFENVAEEIDIPGEYFLDRENGLLYIYPPKSFDNGTIVLSSLTDPMILANDTKGVIFENITFDTGRNYFAKLSNVEDVKIINCSILNFSRGGISLQGCNNLIKGNEIAGVGGDGVQMIGGKLKTLEAGNNIAEYNHIHSFAWDQMSQAPGISLGGVGNIASHNEINNAPHFAFKLNGNDHIIEYNEVYNVVQYHHFDGGALYISNGHSPEQRGHILRHNYFHDICNKRNSIYLDWHGMGTTVEHNLFVNMERTIDLNSGPDNFMNHNVMVDCTIPIRISSHSYRDAYFFGNLKEKWANVTADMLPRIDDMPHKKYPDFVEWLKRDDEGKRFGISFARENLFYNPNLPFADVTDANGFEDNMDSCVKERNVVAKDDPGFRNAAEGDYNLDCYIDGVHFFVDFDKMGLEGYRVGAR